MIGREEDMASRRQTVVSEQQRGTYGLSHDDCFCLLGNPVIDLCFGSFLFSFPSCLGLMVCLRSTLFCFCSSNDVGIS